MQVAADKALAHKKKLNASMLSNDGVEWMNSSNNNLNNTNSDNSNKNNNNKNNSRQDNLCQDVKLDKVKSTEMPSLLSRSRLSTFTNTPVRRTASLTNELSSEMSNTSSTSIHVAASRESTNRLDSSIVINGSVISSLVKYANSIRDTVQEAITCQQNSIASKLGEIAVSLSILPNLTQRINTLVSKVDSLEALLAERPSQLNVTTEECQLLREQISKRTDLLTESLNSLSSIRPALLIARLGTEIILTDVLRERLG